MSLYPTSVCSARVKTTKTGVMHYDFMLEDNSKSLGEAVVTGYGTISTREKTSAITSLKMDEILMPGMTSLEQALEGRVPDMVFMQNSGEVGATARMRIRGTSTLIGNRRTAVGARRYPLVRSCRCDQRAAQRPGLHQLYR